MKNKQEMELKLKEIIRWLKDIEAICLWEIGTMVINGISTEAIKHSKNATLEIQLCIRELDWVYEEFKKFEEVEEFKYQSSRMKYVISKLEDAYNILANDVSNLYFMNFYDGLESNIKDLKKFIEDWESERKTPDTNIDLNVQLNKVKFNEATIDELTNEIAKRLNDKIMR